MMTTKTEVLDFLWEWAEPRGDWAKLLVAYLIQKKRQLTSDEEEYLYSAFLADNGVPGHKPPPQLSKPNSVEKLSSLSLVSISNISGVNRLSKNATLRFDPNLTIVYGGNGTGKTGYVRILRDLGRSYSQPEVILSNVYGHSSGNEKSATVQFKTGEHSHTFVWTGDGSHGADELSRISVFSDRATSIGLSQTRELLVTPVGFQFFPWISTALNSLKQINNNNISLLRKELPSAAVHPGTSVDSYLKKLNKGLPLDLPEAMRVFEPSDVATLARKQAELQNANLAQLERKRSHIQNRISELKLSLNILNNSERVLNEGLWDAYAMTLAEIDKLQRSQSSSLEEVAQLHGVPRPESPALSAMVESVICYSDSLFPEITPNDDLCPYCRQPLSPEAQRLILNYKSALESRDTEALTRSIEQAERYRTRVLDLDLNLQIDPTLLSSEHFNDAGRLLISYYHSLSETVNHFLRNNSETLPPKVLTESDFSAVRATIQTAVNKLTELRTTLDKQLEDLESHRTSILNEIDELNDRLWASANSDTIERHVENLRHAKVLESLTRLLSTNSVTRSAKKAREALLSDELKTAIEEELKALRKGELTVKFEFNTSKGQTRLQQNVAQGHPVPAVMSEGEQKAIALAEFFAELRLESAPAPVIFDDPVTSMDHELIEYVAGRIVDASKQRQVVVFTHNMILLASIREKNGRRRDATYYTVNKSKNESGLLQPESVATLNVNDYISKIEKSISPSSWQYNNKPGETARSGYGNLRSALEVFLETEMLVSTVRRFRSNVSFGQLGAVSGALIDVHKPEILELHRRCCSRIDGHSNPLGVVSEPTIEELENDLERFKKIRSEFEEHAQST